MVDKFVPQTRIAPGGELTYYPEQSFLAFDERKFHRSIDPGTFWEVPIVFSRRDLNEVPGTEIEDRLDKAVRAYVGDGYVKYEVVGQIWNNNDVPRLIVKEIE